MKRAELVSFTSEFLFDLNKVLIKAIAKKAQNGALVSLAPGGQPRRLIQILEFTDALK